VAILIREVAYPD